MSCSFNRGTILATTMVCRTTAIGRLQLVQNVNTLTYTVSVIVIVTDLIVFMSLLSFHGKFAQREFSSLSVTRFENCIVAKTRPRPPPPRPMWQQSGHNFLPSKDKILPESPNKSCSEKRDRGGSG